MTKRLGWFLAGGLLAAILLAGVVSSFASSSPDGLDATALKGCTTDAQGEITGGTCMAQKEQDHQLSGSPLAGYGDGPVPTPVAGVIGVLVTFGAGYGVFTLARRRKGVPVSPLHLGHDSPIHRLPPEVKIAATVLFTVVVVVTPREEFPAFAGYALLLAVVAMVARVPAGWLAKRATIELPFVLLAVALPFAGHGERVDWLGLSLSLDGLHGAWNIFAKGTLGVLASLLLAASTTTRDLIVGMDRLRCPAIITQIATFMLRYLDILVDDARRMRVARLSRGYDPRFLWQVKAFAVSVGSLFLRAYERGERVYLAMVSRGYTGVLPRTGQPAATGRQWAGSAALPLAAAGIAVLAALP